MTKSSLTDSACVEVSSLDLALVVGGSENGGFENINPHVAQELRDRGLGEDDLARLSHVVGTNIPKNDRATAWPAQLVDRMQPLI